ncbi:MAG: argininosuccinate synthase [Deltaproteobacteria bacterium]|nr:argininosuccinate synthase [Deltaproteobacteria bacterium]
MSKNQYKKIVLAYSGGLDTSVILAWLKETYKGEIIAFCADIGQAEETEGLAEKAKLSGATEFVLRDLREEFARDFCFPMLRANAAYEGDYLMGTSIARPLIAKGMMDVAREFGADTISHGATGKGNDQVRFELTAIAIDPKINIIAPWREWDLRSRSDCIAYAQKHGIPVAATKEKPYSMDRNLFHISYEGGILEDPWLEPDESMFILTRDPGKAPDKPRYLTIRYQDGDPISLDGEKMSPAAIIQRLNELGGEHGVGRVDKVENRYVGMKSRGVYETPGGTILHKAHQAVESITMDREVQRLRDSLIPEYASLIYRGFWFSPERLVLQAMIDKAQKGVSGEARIKLYKGNAFVVGRRSDNSLYHQEYATFEADDVFDQSDATGFIRLNALRLRIRALREQKKSTRPV